MKNVPSLKLLQKFEIDNKIKIPLLSNKCAINNRLIKECSLFCSKKCQQWNGKNINKRKFFGQYHQSATHAQPKIYTNSTVT